MRSPLLEINSDLSPDYGSLKGHYPAYTMLSYQRKNSRLLMLPVSLLTSEGWTITWNSHYPPI